MKIGLLTIHRTANYGAVLQTFASKVFLSKYGLVDIIDYSNEHLVKNISLLRFSFSLHGIKMFLHDLLRLPFRAVLVFRFSSFFNEYYNLTKKVKSDDLLNGELDFYDAYVCGSDQIWNPDIVSAFGKIDKNYFLYFSPRDSLKLSFASSIGHHVYNDFEKKEILNLLHDFRLITVRERDGVSQLQTFLENKEIYHVLDPTLMLSMDDWLKELSVSEILKFKKKKYILVYSVPRSDLLAKAVDFFRKKFNLEVIALDPMLFPLSKSDKHIMTAGPKQFIELFYNATFVVTDSFHGTCFSIVFNKPFASISSGKRSNRVTSLLNSLNIKNRFVKTEDDFPDIDATMDYSLITEKLAYSRKQIEQIFDQAFL